MQKFLTPDLTWMRLLGHRSMEPRQALFLDRDGVIMEDKDYLSSPDGVEIIDGAAKAIRDARSAGAVVAVVTNQSGVGRGYFDWADHFAVENRLLDLLRPHDAEPDIILACGHHPEGRPPYAAAHAWRKPAPGMLLEAAARLNVDLNRSMIVGDRASDLQAGRAAGLQLGVIVSTGKGSEDAGCALALQSDRFEVRAARSIGDVDVRAGLSSLG